MMTQEFPQESHAENRPIPAYDIPAYDIPAVNIPALNIPALNIPALNIPALNSPDPWFSGQHSPKWQEYGRQEYRRNEVHAGCSNHVEKSIHTHVPQTKAAAMV